MGIELFDKKFCSTLSVTIIVAIAWMFCNSKVAIAQNNRQLTSLNNNWKTIAENDTHVSEEFFSENYPDNNWQTVNVPHNHDGYFGYRRLLHGNLHGDAWYRKKFSVHISPAGKRFFLFFEGVGSFATVYVNGKHVGEHAGGRTTFTLDITDIIKVNGTENTLVVKASHPPNIKTLPWVCGGCSEERGFSEGSQPMGIFRPVTLIITSDVRITPFGVHAWAGMNKMQATLHLNTTVKNYSPGTRKITIEQKLLNAAKKIVARCSNNYTIRSGDSLTYSANSLQVKNVTLWDTENPYLYNIVTTVKEGNRLLDEIITPFGFRTVAWRTATNQFLLNGKPVYINGVAEYEHLLGKSHAFDTAQILSRIKWIQMAGFNAFRDGHQPHHLLYGSQFDEKGILWWTQHTAHIWYDTPEFRDNFKKLLAQWVIERRNSPSVVLWGLQNESTLPEDFAKECTELIRKLDPTSATQRLVTTCNGGTGTDWNVPQNWTGTYGGDPDTYAGDLKKQVLIGEYGAWRTLDLHTEGGFVQNGPVSEDRFTQLMEKKLQLAESVKDSIAGQFFWLLTSHDNPGRVQGGEALRDIDKIGPVNYKGLLTPWEEPTDAFYMYRSKYAAAKDDPMVYIVSHTWPGRWVTPGVKDNITVYSNCDEVELFNDFNAISLGRLKKQTGSGTGFSWKNVNIRYNILYAVGYINGKMVAKDTVQLHHLPQAPGLIKMKAGAANNTAPARGYHYWYRINCGGPEYIDCNGNKWLADVPAKGNSLAYTADSWSGLFSELSPAFASQRRIFNPVQNTKDDALFRTFRYGLHELKFNFTVPDGEYLVELYFTEPWLGVGGGNAKGMRLVDVAVNNTLILKNLDIWEQAGAHTALKKSFKVKVTGGQLVVHFPNSTAGQALISAIAIASVNAPPDNNIKTTGLLQIKGGGKLSYWLDEGENVYEKTTGKFAKIPPRLFGAEWVKHIRPGEKLVEFEVQKAADVYIAVDSTINPGNDFKKHFETTLLQIATTETGNKVYQVYRKRYAAGNVVSIAQTGLAAGTPFLLLAMPADNMEPAFDLKTTTTYNIDKATWGIGVMAAMENDKPVVRVADNQPVFIDFNIHTGVADKYALTFKYYYPLDKNITGRLQLLDAGKTMMMEEPVKINFTRPGKWNTITFTTASMINAGHYTVRFIIEGGAQLAIRGVDVQ